MGRFTKRVKALTVAAAAAVSVIPAAITGTNVSAAYGTGKNVVEYLNRGITAVNTGSGMMVSWRYNANDADNAVFKLYRDNSLIYTSEQGMATSFLDKNGTASSVYKVETLVNGVVTGTDTCNLISNSSYFDIPMDVPPSGVTPPMVNADGETYTEEYTYSPNDCSVGDVDGDGQYEIFVKWDPSNSHDNSQGGYTGNVYIDCYTLQGKRLWRVDLGKNIRAGAHYTQFLVADFDGDGKAEMTCKTADGTVDGKGKVIGDASKDYRNQNGYILDGPEYYTLFDGATGAALDTVNYEYPRGEVTKATWGDAYGNRVDRFVSSAVYCDGVHPSAVCLRGYYTRMTVVAYDVVNKKLVKRWGYDTGYDPTKPGYGDGNHNGMAADVDGDGKQEYFVGAVAFDDDGSILWCNDKGHGDAIHLSDFLPERPGLELWVCHEHEPYGLSLIDAKTGKDIFHYDGTRDTGRCAAGNIYSGNDGAEFWGAVVNKIFDGSGNALDLQMPAMNFLIYWDGDPERELLNDISITKMTAEKKIQTLLTANGCLSNNSTKATPNLSADILGDWREELVLRTEDNKALRVFCTPYETKYRITTLMHDPQYRMQVSAEQAGYNQPPHPSFYLGSEEPLPDRPAVTLNTGGATVDMAKTYIIKNRNSGLYLTAESGKSGANVVQSGINSKDKTSYWTFEDAGQGYYRIKNSAGDIYLDLTGGKAAAGTNIEVYRNSGTDAQLFKLVDNGNGSYVLTTKVSGGNSCVEIVNALTESGANVQQWGINGHDCQSWVLESVNIGTEVDDEIIVGDLNRDGKVNCIDFILMKRKGDSLNGSDRQYGDTNADGFVNEKDMRAMASFLTKKGEFEAVKNKSAFYYAQEATFSQGVKENTNEGFRRDGYVNLDNTAGSYLEWKVTAPEKGNYLCSFSIANGSADNRPMKIEVNNGVDFWQQDFLSTSGWTAWNTRGIVLPLEKGVNIIRMTSITAGGGPNIDSLYMEKTDEPIAEVFIPEEKPNEPDPKSEQTIYIAGDSTVQTYRASYAPQQGWGAYLSEQLGGAAVSNQAIAGRSSKSFYDNGRLDTILDTIKQGDLLLVQFGINDSASTNAERYAPTCGKVPGDENSFEWYLQKYIDGAKAKGATPVLVTTVIGLKAYNASTKQFAGSYTNYCDAMKQLAAYYKIPCIDLNSLMVSHYNSIGYDTAYTYHLISAVEGSTDMTHFTETGAKAVAKLVADEMKKQGLA